MAKPILVANWKNHPSSVSLADALLKGLSKKRELYKKISFFIAPPLTYLELAGRRTSGFASCAVQDLSSRESGTHTGHVTPDILKNFGVRLAILGHSERRALGETDAEVAAKVKIALHAGITPLVCVGEKVHDPEGEHFQFLREQIKSSLSSLKKRDEAKKIVIAYEPVWAIGKRAKDAIRPEDLSQMILFIKKVLTDLFGRETALRIPVLYGGSVEPVNAENLYKDTGIRGFLIGHASLEYKSLKEIAEAVLKN